MMKDQQAQMKDLTLLGNKEAGYTFDYAPELLEAFDNQYIERDTMVHLSCPEFTTMCPMTNQPDFATVYISYIPDQKMIESKALKLYLFSYRNYGGFHEDSMNQIMDDIIKLIQPRYIEVLGKFNPRGGIAIHPLCTYGMKGTRFEQLASERLFNQAIY